MRGYLIKYNTSHNHDRTLQILVSCSPIISATALTGIFWARSSIKASISSVNPVLLLAQGTSINLIEPHFWQIVRGTLAWIYALNWKKLRCRHTRSFVSWMQLFGDLQFEHSNRLPGIKSIWISICFLALLNSIDLMYHGSWRFNASLNRSSWDRVTHYNSGNDIIKPYPIPTQNSEEPTIIILMVNGLK